MCTLLEDLVAEAKYKIHVQDRIIIILSILLLFFITTTIYLGYNVWTNNDPNKDSEDVSEVQLQSLGDEFEEENNWRPLKRRRIVRFKL